MNGKPDALMVPASMKHSARMVDRLDSICLIGEKFLGLDRRGGETACVRIWPPKGEYLFVTSSDCDEFFFPLTHPKGGQSRYRWEPQTNGMYFGYYQPGALDARHAVTAPAASSVG